MKTARFSTYFLSGIVVLVFGLFVSVSTAKSQTTISQADKDFMVSAMQGGLMEVRMGELTARRALRPDVKAYGQLMVKDHTAINSDLKALAAQKGIVVPETLDAKHQAMLDKLAAVADTEFDTTYIDHMIRDHQEDLRDFKTAAGQTQDSEFKAFLDKTIPVLDQHLGFITDMKK